MHAQKSSGLGIIPSGFLKCFEDELSFGFFDRLMIFRDLHTGHGLLFQQGFGEIFGLNQLRRAEYDGPFDDLPPFLWVLWRFRWNALRGERTLEARATYADGTTQSEERRFPYSGGSIAYIPITVIPVPPH